MVARCDDCAKDLDHCGFTPDRGENELRTQRPTNHSLKREPCRMPRSCGKLTCGLTGNRLDQRRRRLGLSHELRALIAPSAEEFLTGDIDAGHIAEINDQSSIADH